MKKLCIRVFAFFVPTLFFGQGISNPSKICRNTLYFEAFGQGIYNAFSFDRLYSLDRKVKTSFSAGLTVIPHPELFVIAAPISYNYIFGQRNHHLELGIGFTVMLLRQGNINASESYFDNNGLLQSNNFVGHSNDFYSFFTPKIGYRFQKQTGGLFLRLTLTPPIAGINKIGGVQGGKYNQTWSYTEYFTSAAFFGYRAFPWAGLSIGWTLKK